MPRQWTIPHPFGRLVLVERGVEEAFGAPEAPLLAALPAGASSLRRASFVAGRAALAAAARLLGAELSAVGSTPRGAPALPAGLSGSVSHKRLGSGEGLSVVAAALVTELGSEPAAVGVDLECKAPARPEIASRILTRAERARLSGGEADWVRVLGSFSLKESIYKAVDPFLGRYVGFLEAELQDVGGSWPAEGGRSVAAALQTRAHEPTFELEAFLQGVPGAEGLIISAARARPRVTGSAPPPWRSRG